MRIDARFLAYEILNQFNNKIKLDKLFEKTFIKYDPDSRARARTVAIINDIIRLIGRIDFMIKKVSGKGNHQITRSILSILRIGFYEIYLDGLVPDYAAVDSAVELAKKKSNRRSAGFVNAVLRKFIRKKNNDKNWFNSLSNDPEWNSMPMWIQDRWKKNLGSKGLIEMLESVNKSPPNFVRIQDQEDSLEEVIEYLLDEGIEAEIFSKSFLKIKGGTAKVLQTKMFKNGGISIQNPASAGVVNCLDVRPGDIVVDVCAAPGTKSLYLSSLVGDSGRVFASDIIKERVEMGMADLERHGKTNIQWEVKNATKDDFTMTDRMLIDAPCTGTGVLGRKPDIRWRRKKSDIQEMSNKQYEILNHCSKFINPNGIIVYATCSIEPEENWDVVDRFLNFNTSFCLDDIHSMVPKSWIDKKGALRTLPYMHGVDGMFAVRLKRSL